MISNKEERIANEIRRFVRKGNPMGGQAQTVALCYALVQQNTLAGWLEFTSALEKLRHRKEVDYRLDAMGPDPDSKLRKVNRFKKHFL